MKAKANILIYESQKTGWVYDARTPATATSWYVDLALTRELYAIYNNQIFWERERLKFTDFDGNVEQENPRPLLVGSKLVWQPWRPVWKILKLNIYTMTQQSTPGYILSTI